MVKVLDPDGLPWTVARRRGPLPGDAFLGRFDELGGIVIILEAIVLWPPWFLAKFLGVPWRIVIDRRGNEVGEERVRGWRRSSRRIQELADIAAAGQMEQHLAAQRAR